MQQIYPTAWIRLAGNAAEIKANGTHHWRCWVHRREPVISLRTFQIVGSSSNRNCLPGTAPNGNDLGITAWIDYYGILAVTPDGFATIQLLEPPV